MRMFTLSSDLTHSQTPMQGARPARAFVLALLLAMGWPGAAFAVEANGPWGVYPDCVAPAVPLEMQAWWLQDGEELPRHLHQGVCIPNARTADCSDPRNPVVTEPTSFTSRVITYNNPDEVNWIRWS